MARIVAVSNQKGGVGKTTTAINLGASLAIADQRVLLVDVDPQANLTSGLGQRERAAQAGTVYHALTDAQPGVAPLPIVDTGVQGLFLAPSDRHLTGAEIEMVGLPERECRLRQVLDPRRGEYDYIIIRHPPVPGTSHIDYERFAGATADPETEHEVNQLRATLPGIKLVLSVARLDYCKGISNRLEGYELFLESNPDYHGKVALLLVVVPSRIGVVQYDLMKRQLEELVGKINGRFGRVGWTPVVYQYRNVPFSSLVALYSVSEVCLVTPLRDGMNLVAKEYLATRSDGSGVLILSEMAGAAKELPEAIIVNPNNRAEIAAALKDALEVSSVEQQKRNLLMQRRLRRYVVTRWAEDFLGALVGMKEVQNRIESKLLPLSAKREILTRFKSSSSRLLFLDYDGTLTPLVRHPSLAKPDGELTPGW